MCLSVLSLDSYCVCVAWQRRERRFDTSSGDLLGCCVCMYACVCACARVRVCVMLSSSFRWQRSKKRKMVPRTRAMEKRSYRPYKFRVCCVLMMMVCACVCVHVCVCACVCVCHAKFLVQMAKKDPDHGTSKASEEKAKVWRLQVQCCVDDDGVCVLWSLCLFMWHSRMCLNSVLMTSINQLSQ